MGHSFSTKLDDMKKRVAERQGKIAMSGRYHKSKEFSVDYEADTTVLGSGFSGQITLARSRRDNQKYAVKCLKTLGVDEVKLQDLELECEIHLGMDHPHVARLIDVYETPEQLILVMELLAGGTLCDRLEDQSHYKESDAAETAYMMLLAVNYLHSHNIVHRDLKLENFLYESKETNHLKLIDFGFSRIWNSSTKMQRACGTLEYTAPEVLNTKYEGGQCDMWSLGVIVFLLLAGYPPFHTKTRKETRNLICSGTYNMSCDEWKGISADAVDFVQKCLVVSVQERLTPVQALEHQWIKNREANNIRIELDVIIGLRHFAHASHFRRACMQMMAWSLSLADRQKVREMFLSFDKSHEGTIKLSELQTALKDNFLIDFDEARHIFESLDVNHDEEIHYTDFLAAMVQTRIQVHDDLIYAAFNRFDKDHSGLITVENLREVLGETFEGTEIESLIQEADKNGDGEISYKEFVEYIKTPDHAKHDDEHFEVAARIIDTEMKKRPARRATVSLSTPYAHKKDEDNIFSRRATEDLSIQGRKKDNSAMKNRRATVDFVLEKTASATFSTIQFCQDRLLCSPCCKT